MEAVRAACGQRRAAWPSTCRAPAICASSSRSRFRSRSCRSGSCRWASSTRSWWDGCPRRISRPWPSGNLYFFGVAVFGMGVLFALDPVVSQAVGAGDSVGVARGVQRGMVLAVALTVLVMALLAPGRPGARGAQAARRGGSRGRPLRARPHPGRPAVLRVHRVATEPSGDGSRSRDPDHGRRRERAERLPQLGVDLRTPRLTRPRRRRLGVGDERQPLVHGRGAPGGRVAPARAVAAPAPAGRARGRPSGSSAARGRPRRWAAVARVRRVRRRRACSWGCSGRSSSPATRSRCSSRR